MLVISKKSAFVFMVAALCVAGAWAGEDEGKGGGAAPTGALGVIPAMTVAHEILDFDAMAGGATTIGAIQAAFPNNVLANLTFSACTGSTPGVYNTNPEGGRALAANPDLSLGLFLVDAPVGAFGCTDDLTIDFGGGGVTEFCFQWGDWNGPVNINSDQGSVQVDTNLNPGTTEYCVGSATQFTFISLTTFPENPGGNWVVPGMRIPEMSVPVELQSFDVE